LRVAGDEKGAEHNTDPWRYLERNFAGIKPELGKRVRSPERRLHGSGEGRPFKTAVR
jgi:hypothetical protein